MIINKLKNNDGASDEVNKETGDIEETSVIDEVHTDNEINITGESSENKNHGRQ